MNRNLTLSVLLLASMVNAQVTVNYGQLDQGGVQLTMYMLSAPGSATEPTDGADQTWDLSTVTLQPIGTLDFVTATGTPYASTYPGANWVWMQTFTGLGSQYMYLDVNSAGIEVHATDVPTDINVYTDPKKVMQFPMTLGQSFTDAYTDMDGPASVTWGYTGHGTAITPVGTFADAVKVVSTEDDLVLWNTNPLHPLVIDDSDNVIFFAPSNTGITDRELPSVQVYPNPCEGQFFVDVSASAPWRILDVQGRVLRTGNFNGMGTQVLEIADLATGSYLLVLDGVNSQRMVRFSRK